MADYSIGDVVEERRKEERTFPSSVSGLQEAQSYAREHGWPVEPTSWSGEAQEQNLLALSPSTGFGEVSRGRRALSFRGIDRGGTSNALSQLFSMAGQGELDAGGPELRQTGTLSDEQESIMNQLGPLVQSGVGEGVETFRNPDKPSQYAAPPTEGQQQANELLGQYAEQGTTPEAAQQHYERFMRPEAEERLEETQAGVKETYAAKGLDYSSEQAEAMAEAGAKWEKKQLEAIGGIYQQYRQTGERATEALAQAGARRQKIVQRGMELAMQDFKSSQPENSPIIDKAMKLMNVPMTATFGVEEPAGLGFEVAMGLAGAMGQRVAEEGEPSQYFEQGLQALTSGNNQTA